MNPIRTITVYCSSSTQIAGEYFNAGVLLGRSIAQNGWQLVYGGNRIGLMATVADAARAAGGKVIGITPRMMVDEGITDDLCDELIVTDNMRDRKALLEQRGDAFIALPGGLGTFEEVFEVLVGRLLGYHAKPIIFLNVAGYYDPLLTMIEHGIEQNFIKTTARRAYHVSGSVADAITFLKAQPISGEIAGQGGLEPSAAE